MNNIVEDQMREALADDIRGTRSTEYLKAFSTGDQELGAAFAAPPTLQTNEGDTVTVWATDTGEPRQIPSLMLAKTLKKRRNGQRAFETINPATGLLTGPVPEWTGGQTPCWFNPKSPRYAELSKIPGLAGFRCESEHLASEFDAEMHAKHRHDRRYAVAKDHLDRMEREETRALQQRQIDAMLAMAGAGKAARQTHDCDQCERFFDSAQGLTLHKSKEHRADA